MNRALKSVGIAMLAVSLGGWGWGSTTQSRHDATRFILEKLEQQQGRNWDRVGRDFLWTYEFDSSGCNLTIVRSASYGDVFTQRIPVADTLPLWRNGDFIDFICSSTSDCITHQMQSATLRNDESRVSRTRVMVMRPDDLPKVRDAFAELHRLCDDAYRPDERARPDEGASPP